MPILKTLVSAFKGGGRSRAPLARAFPFDWPYWLDPAGGRGPFDYRGSVQRAFLENPVAQRAVRLVAEGVGGAPLLAGEAELVKLVGATSAGQPLLETLAAQVLLHGNAYIQIVKDGAGRPVDLFALRPERVSVVPDADGWPAAWRYKVGDRVLTLPTEDGDGWPSVVHIKAFHPSDDHYGAGCLSAADQAVAIHNAAANWNRALLENAARPSGALVMEGEAEMVTAEQFERLKGELAAAFSGERNSGRPMLLSGGLK